MRYSFTQISSFCLFLIFLFSISACEKRTVHLLVFSKTAGYRHASIETGIEAIQELGKTQNIQVKATEDASLFQDETLRQYDAVVFLNTTGDVLNEAQEAAFERYIQAGGGFVGIHAATDTEYHWPWYGRLVGAYFLSHPEIQEANLEVVDEQHPATRELPKQWKRTDEWYNFKSIQANLNILLNIDESSYEGGQLGKNHPMAWCHEYDGGRAFYTALGHTKESYAEPAFLQHLLGGIRYAIGETKNIDYSLAKTPLIPPENRFKRTILTQNLDEPMEFDRFEDGRIIIVERKGNIKILNPQSDIIRTIAQLPVHTVHEDGLLGVAIDPNYGENQWIYLCYSPLGPEAKQNVSRFVFDQDSLHFSSEKIVLEIPVQREECCHSAGSLEFDSKGHLFISVGDNTNPFDSDGFAPIDERRGRAAWDAQKSSANTNDLRGKILRILPQADGTYTIPEGNLFPSGTPKTRPEIFVMGCRNPFRFSIDAYTQTLYWGDVGPDAGKDKALRGPKGLDGINVAKTPGFYGWPYFRGNNQAYFDYDFTSQQHREKFDPENPINDSPNNTGLRELPSPRSSLIWYSYDASEEFPWVGNGGKNPMAGPVFHRDLFDSTATSFPDYFDNKLFIYEWMRNWIYVLQLDDDGQLLQAHPFMPNAEFARPMDMLFDNEGHLYVLEYGNQWFARNLNAQLSKIEYIRSNRAPIARIEANKIIGAAPLTVLFSAENSEDLDGDPLSFEWRFTASTVQDRSIYPRFTFEKAGTYTVELRVIDADGNESKAQQLIQVGNDPPNIAWKLEGNRSFYWDQESLAYAVEVSDQEDGHTALGTIDTSQIKISFDYLPQGYDLTRVAQGHQTIDNQVTFDNAVVLMESSDCYTCHAMDKIINGPSFLDIAKRYRGDDLAVRNLSQNVINGSSGSWGERAMSAHPQLTESTVNEMVFYILQQEPKLNVISEYPIVGTFQMGNKIQEGKEGSYILMASYTDQGNGEIGSITQQEEVVLHHPKRPAKTYNWGSQDLKIEKVNDRECLSGIQHQSFFVLEAIDLTMIENIRLSVRFEEAYEGKAHVEIRQGSLEGELLGKVALPKSDLSSAFQPIDLPVSNHSGLADLYFAFQNGEQENENIMALEYLYFQRTEDRSVSN